MISLYFQLATRAVSYIFQDLEILTPDVKLNHWFISYNIIFSNTSSSSHPNSYYFGRSLQFLHDHGLYKSVGNMPYFFRECTRVLTDEGGWNKVHVDRKSNAQHNNLVLDQINHKEDLHFKSFQVAFDSWATSITVYLATWNTREFGSSNKRY